MKTKSVAIVGGGPVGSLQACYMAEKGYHVEIYEMRDDIRKATKVFGRSINLALSHRGREALKEVDLEKEVLRNGIPMYGRMIHDLDGSTHSIPYGKKDEHIMSIDRRRLNELLVSAAEKYPQVHWNFCHKLVSCDFETKILTFERMDTKEIVTTKFDLVFGCDGAYSNLRNHVMKCSRMKFSQEFIEDGYMELRIPAGPNGEFLIEKNFLHIWPRHTFMMIGLPNVQDHSFVMTLFMPFKIFQQLDGEEKVVNFFRENFNDALKIMGEAFVVDAFRRLSPLPLVSIKCSPYNYEGCCVLLGDAAHAMVPFYGQGLNCGLEDVLILKDFMNQYNDDFEKALNEFSSYRTKDAQTMNDLAMRNYKEMRSDVNTIYFYLRKRLDTFLYWILPRTWVPLYTMVSFSRMRYHKCLEGKLWQDRVLRSLTRISLVGAVAVGVCLAYRNSWIEAFVAGWQKDFTLSMFW